MYDFKESMILSRLGGIKDVVIVGSGKGGVGKSTFAALLALRLRDLGRVVGILDLDLHGASIPYILGDPNAYVEGVKGGFKPALIHGIKVMSLRMFVGDRPTPLRGVRKREVLKYLMALTVWGDLDFLVVDLPPGVSDELLTLINYVKGKHIAITIPTRTSLDVLVRYVKLLNSVGHRIPLLVVNNALNTRTEGVESIINSLHIPYVVMPYVEGIEDTLLKGRVPNDVVATLDRVISSISK